MEQDPLWLDLRSHPLVLQDPRLKGQLEKLGLQYKSILECLDAEKAASRERLAEITAKMDALNADHVAQKDALVQEHKQAVQRYEKEQERLASEISDSKKEISVLCGETLALGKTHAQLREAEQRLAEQAHEMACLAQANVGLKNRSNFYETSSTSESQRNLDLIREIRNLKTKLFDLESQLSASEYEKMKLHHENTILADKNLYYKQHYDKTESEFKAQESVLRSEVARLKADQFGHAVETDRLSKQLQAATNDLTKKTIKSESLLVKIELLENEIYQCKKQKLDSATELNVKLMELERKTQLLTSEIDELNTHNKRLVQENTDLHIERSSLLQQLGSIKQEHAQNTEQLNTKISQLQAFLKEYQDNEKSLRATQDSLRFAADASGAPLLCMDNATLGITALYSKYIQAQTDAEQLQRRYDSVQEEKQKLETQLKTHQSLIVETAVLHKNVSYLKDQLKQAVERANDLHKQLNLKSSEHACFAKTIESNARVIDNYRIQVQQMMVELSRHAKQHDSSLLSLSKLNPIKPALSSSQKTHLFGLSSSNPFFNTKTPAISGIDSLLREKENLISEVTTTKSTISDLENNNKHLKAELETLVEASSIAKQLQEQNAALAEKNRSLESQLLLYRETYLQPMTKHDLQKPTTPPLYILSDLEDQEHPHLSTRSHRALYDDRAQSSASDASQECHILDGTSSKASDTTTASEQEEEENENEDEMEDRRPQNSRSKKDTAIVDEKRKNILLSEALSSQEQFYQREMASLKTIQESLELQNERLTRECDRLTLKHDEYIEKIQSLETEVRTSKAASLKYLDKVLEVQENTSQLSSELHTTTREIARLQAEHESAEKHVSRLSIDVSEYLAKIRNLEHQIAEIREERDNLKQANVVLKLKMTSTSPETSQISKHDLPAAMMNIQNEGLRKDQIRLLEREQSLQSRIEALNRENAVLGHQLNDAESKLARQIETCAAETEKLQANTSELHQAQQDMLSLRAQIKALESALSETRGNTQGLSDPLSSLTTSPLTSFDIESMNATQLVEKVKSLKLHIDSLIQINTSLEQQQKDTLVAFETYKTSTDQKVFTATNHLTEFTKTNGELEDQVRELVGSLDQAKADLHDAVESYHTKISQLNSEISQLKQELSSKDELTGTYLLDIAKITAERDEYKKDYGNEVTKHGKVVEENQRFEQNIAKLHSDYEFIKTKYEESLETSQKLQKELAEKLAGWDAEKRRLSTSISNYEEKLSKITSNPIFYQKHTSHATAGSIEGDSTQKNANSSSSSSTTISADNGGMREHMSQSDASIIEGLREILTLVRNEKQDLSLRYDLAQQNALLFKEKYEHSAHLLAKASEALESASSASQLQLAAATHQHEASHSKSATKGIENEALLLRESNETLRRDLSVALQDRDAIQAQCESIKANMEGLLRSMEQKDSELALKDSQLADAHRSTARWQKRVDELHENLKKLSISALKVDLSKYQELEAELVKCQAALQAKESECVKLANDAQTHTARVEELEKTIQALSSKNTKAINVLRLRSADLQAKVSLLTEKEKEIAQLTQSLTESRSSSASSVAPQIVSLQEQIRLLESQVSDLQKQVLDLQTSQKELEDEKARLLQANEDLNEANKKYKATIRSNRASLYAATTAKRVPSLPEASTSSAPLDTPAQEEPSDAPAVAAPASPNSPIVASEPAPLSESKEELAKKLQALQKEIFMNKQLIVSHSKPEEPTPSSSKRSYGQLFTGFCTSGPNLESALTDIVAAEQMHQKDGQDGDAPRAKHLRLSNDLQYSEQEQSEIASEHEQGEIASEDSHNKSNEEDSHAYSDGHDEVDDNDGGDDNDNVDENSNHTGVDDEDEEKDPHPGIVFGSGLRKRQADHNEVVSHSDASLEEDDFSHEEVSNANESDHSTNIDHGHDEGDAHMGEDSQADDLEPNKSS